MVDKLAFIDSIIISGASEHTHIGIFLRRVLHCKSKSEDMIKIKKKKNLPGAPAALTLGQCATVTVTGPTDTLMLLLSILMPETGGDKLPPDT